MTMIRIVAATLAFTLTSGAALAFEHSIASSIDQKMSPNDIARFVARRCAGLYIFVGSVSSGRPEIEAEATEISSLFMQRAHELERYYEADSEQALSSTVKGVLRIADTYREAGGANMAATGNYFPDDSAAGADLDLCNSIVGGTLGEHGSFGSAPRSGPGGGRCAARRVRLERSEDPSSSQDYPNRHH